MTLTSTPSTNPQVGQVAQAILTAVDETAVPEPSDTIVELPGGLVGPGGHVIRTAEIRELNGADEEALSHSTRDGEPDWPKYMTEILARGLVSLGDYPADAAMRSKMLVGDQGAILLAIRRATYGNEYETTIRCPFCSKESPVAYDIRAQDRGGDIPYKRLPDPENVYRTIPLRNNSKAEIRLVTAADSLEVIKDERLTQTEQNTLLLARCVKTIDGMPTLGETTMREMSAGNRRILEKHLTDSQPGPELGEVKGNCPVCAREVKISLGIPALFLQGS